MNEIRLDDPFPPEKVSLRQGAGGRWLAYIDARDVMQRLDDVVGSAGWEDMYHETRSNRIICELSILFRFPDLDDRWVTKSDGAGDTGIEGQKGAISDAFKRAAVKFGIGRYLYDLPAFHSEEAGREYLKALGFTSKQMKTKYWKGLIAAASDDDSGKARELWDEMTSEQQLEIWRDLSSGVRSTLKDLLKATGVDDEEV